MPLLTAQDVRDLVPQEDFSDAQLAVTMRLVAGWLLEATGLLSLPDPIPDTDLLFAPALELVALVAENPTALASKTVGPTSRMWPLASRRDAILKRVRGRYSGQPSGDFPDPVPLPDPNIPTQLVWWTGGR